MYNNCSYFEGYLKMANYFKTREKIVVKNTETLKEDLPAFCDEYFIGIEQTTSPLTRQGYCYDLRIFFDFLVKKIPYFKGKDIHSIELSDLEHLTSHDIELFISYLSFYTFNGKEYSNTEKGKARKISSLRSFFKYFFNNNEISKDVASKVAVPKQHTKDIIRLETNESNDMLNAIETGDNMTKHQHQIQRNTKYRDLAIITLLLGTGIRVSELVGLNVTDMDFRNRAMTVTRKGGNVAILYFGDEVAEAVQTYIETERASLLRRCQKINKEEDALFLSLQVKRITVRAVELLVKKYAQTAVPLKKITPHKLRSTFGTNLYRATGDIYLVADVLGHSDINTTTKHYAALKENSRKIAAEITKVRTDEDNPD